MKKCVLLLLGMALAACTSQSDPLFGTWNVSKVNLDFDERVTTPDMVKQVGDMERQNRLRIGDDSTMVFVSCGMELKGRLTLGNGGRVFCNGELFGTWADGKIVTKNMSPLGEIRVEYSK